MYSVPASINDVDLDWIAGVGPLCERIGTDCPVSVTVRSDAESLGQLSERGIITVTAPDGIATEFFLKLKAAHSGSHRYAMSRRLYERECYFYKYIAPLQGVRTPATYYCEFDPTSENACVIMEHIKTAHPLDQINGINRNQLQLALNTLGNVALSFWNQSGKLAGLPTVEADFLVSAGQDIANYLEEFTRRFPAVMSENRARLTQQVAWQYTSLIHQTQLVPQTLCHWDYRVENMLFDERREQVYVIDWQAVMIHSPAWDLAYLLGTNVDQQHALDWYPDAVDFYLRKLGRSGARLTKAELDWQIKVCLLILVQIPIVTGAQMDVSKPRSRALVEVITNRLYHMIEALDAQSVLSD